MLDLSAIEVILVKLFRTITGLPFIIADQDAPRPQGQYGSIKIVGVTGNGWDAVTFENQVAPDLDLIESIRGLRTLSVSTNIYRSLALQKVEDLKVRLQSSSSQQSMRVDGLGLSTMSESRDLAELLSNQTEPRAQIDISFYVANEAKLITRAIETAEITGEYQYANRTVPITIEV